jgi:hypothetical protein
MEIWVLTWDKHRNENIVEAHENLGPDLGQIHK